MGSAQQQRKQLAGPSCFDDTKSTQENCSSSLFSLSPSNSFSYSSCSSNDNDNHKVDKTVRFAPQTNIFKHPSRAHYSREERGDTWWSKAEMAKKQQKAAGMARRIKNNKGESPSSCLDELINTTRYIRTTTDDATEFAILSSDAQFMDEHSKCLVPWTCRDRNGRGLETWLSDKYHRSRDRWTREARNAVLLEGATTNTGHYSSSSSAAFAPEDGTMARNYQDLSRASVILARLLAEADALAAARYQACNNGEGGGSSNHDKDQDETRKSSSTPTTLTRAPPRRASSRMGKLARSLVRRTAVNS